MIAIDLDGTLLSPRGQVTDRTRAAVHKALDAGLLVCFATGRNWTESEAVLEAVGHYSTAVFVGGAMVVDTQRRVALHRTLMQPGLAAELCGFFENLGHAALALQDTAATGVDYLISEQLVLEETTEAWMRVATKCVHRVPNLSTFGHEHTIRVGIVAPSAETAAIAPQLVERFGERIVYHSIPVMSYGVDVLEVFDPAVSKWQGLLHVAATHNIDPAHIIAIGDDLNDLSMITNAGLGVAMGNARPQVKQVAKRIIGSNAEDGLAIFLEELVQSRAVDPLVE